MKSFLKYWLPLLGWLGVIFIGSMNVMSAEHTSRFIVPFLLWLKPGMAPHTIWVIIVFMRKCAHVGEYAVLALLMWRGIRWWRRLSIRMSTRWGVALLGWALFGWQGGFSTTVV